MSAAILPNSLKTSRPDTITNGTPVTVRATITNVLNKHYWTGFSRGLTLGTPRTAVLSATVEL